MPFILMMAMFVYFWIGLEAEGWQSRRWTRGQSQVQAGPRTGPGLITMKLHCTAICVLGKPFLKNKECRTGPQNA
jgi:hypothetical protein